MAEINKKVLRKLYPRGGDRKRITTTLPVGIDARLRDMVMVSRGGEASFLLTFSLDAMMTILAWNMDTKEWGGDTALRLRLRALGVALAHLSGRGDDMAMALRVMAQEAEKSA